MPTLGLSLVGFMDQQQAISHLRTPCLPNPSTATDVALIAEWSAATARLGQAPANAGAPTLQQIPQSDPHIANLLNGIYGQFLSTMLARGATFQMVEIDPLLAFQFTIDVDRSNYHCGRLSKPPTWDELLRLCLPDTPPNDALHASVQGQSVLVKSRSLNLVIVNQGPIQGIIPETIGIQFAWTVPFVHVVRFDNKCYLHNGYHRAYGARIAGSHSVPCLFRDIATQQEVPLRDDGTTFPLSAFQTANPPTMGHFTQGKAHPVALRAAMRILQVNWSQHTLYDE
jgi:hypothetical protein